MVLGERKGRGLSGGEDGGSWVRMADPFSDASFPHKGCSKELLWVTVTVWGGGKLIGVGGTTYIFRKKLSKKICYHLFLFHFWK